MNLLALYLQHFVSEQGESTIHLDRNLFENHSYAALEIPMLIPDLALRPQREIWDEHGSLEPLDLWLCTAGLLYW